MSTRAGSSSDFFGIVYSGWNFIHRLEVEQVFMSSWFQWFSPNRREGQANFIQFHHLGQLPHFDRVHWPSELLAASTVYEAFSAARRISSRELSVHIADHTYNSGSTIGVGIRRTSVDVEGLLTGEDWAAPQVFQDIAGQIKRKTIPSHARIVKRAKWWPRYCKGKKIKQWDRCQGMDAQCESRKNQVSGKIPHEDRSRNKRERMGKGVRTVCAPEPFTPRRPRPIDSRHEYPCFDLQKPQHSASWRDEYQSHLKSLARGAGLPAKPVHLNTEYAETAAVKMIHSAENGASFTWIPRWSTVDWETRRVPSNLFGLVSLWTSSQGQSVGNSLLMRQDQARRNMCSTVPSNSKRCGGAISLSHRSGRVEAQGEPLRRRGGVESIMQQHGGCIAKFVEPEASFRGFATLRPPASLQIPIVEDGRVVSVHAYAHRIVNRVFGSRRFFLRTRSAWSSCKIVRQCAPDRLDTDASAGHLDHESGGVGANAGGGYKLEAHPQSSTSRTEHLRDATRRLRWQCRRCPEQPIHRAEFGSRGPRTKSPAGSWWVCMAGLEELVPAHGIGDVLYGASSRRRGVRSTSTEWRSSRCMDTEAILRGGHRVWKVGPRRRTCTSLVILIWGEEESMSNRTAEKTRSERTGLEWSTDACVLARQKGIRAIGKSVACKRRRARVLPGNPVSPVWGTSTRKIQAILRGNTQKSGPYIRGGQMQ
ncbi:hypothetical protein C8R45DRAFT_1162609 [Mycena sanguinolenta]|nr:hypothetical protein C8R45DRAFT_1162609 [Mycena sanguinolenta]